MAERTEITKDLCEHVRILLAGGATADKAAKIAGIGEATVYRIKKANYDPEEYKRNRMAETNREKQRDKQPTENQLAEEQVPGQICMDLKEKEPEEQGKQNRFIAAMVDKMCREQATMVNDICIKLDKINDSLSLLRRALWKE